MLTNYDVMGNEETRNPPTFLTESLLNPLHNQLHMLVKSILMILVSNIRSNTFGLTITRSFLSYLTIVVQVFDDSVKIFQTRFFLFLGKREGTVNEIWTFS